MEINRAPAEEFTSLFSSHYDALCKLAYKLTGNLQNTEDIVQEAFLNAYRGWPRFRKESSPYTWLYRITVNCSYRYMDRIKKLPVESLTEKWDMTEAQVIAALPQSSDSEDAAMAAEMREKCLGAFLRCLPARQRIAFTLRVILDLSLKETAEIMETSAGNVKALASRARAFMKQLMENRCSYLNPANPCKCHIWVEFALQHGIISRNEISRFRQAPVDIASFAEEVGILHRIKVLHRMAAPGKDPVVFINRIKTLIAGGKLKLLS